MGNRLHTFLYLAEKVRLRFMQATARVGGTHAESFFFSYLDGNAVGFLGVVIGLDRKAHHYRVIAISIP